ncbi:hypothetical protein LTR95_011853 [Oleoguttula sp. CCFEE 5521]
MKNHLITAPLLKRRHNREFKLSAATNVGTLPGRLQTLFLVGYLAMSIALTVITIDWHTPDQWYDDGLNRTGYLAVMNMIPLFVLAGRNNPLIFLLGISFDTYNLIHRWIGRIVVFEAVAHTAFWLAKKTFTMPDAKAWAVIASSMAHSQKIMAGTIGTFAFIGLLLSSPSIFRHAFYETFLHVHIVLAVVAIVGTWMHIEDEKSKVFLVAAVSFWIIERIVRIISLIRRNVGNGGTKAEVEALPGDAVRVTLRIAKPWKFRPGQHIYMYMPSVGLWTSHPFSLAWSSEDDDPHNEKGLPMSRQDIFAAKQTTMSLIIRRRTGFTDTMFKKAELSPAGKFTTTTFVEGPYGNQSFASYGTVMLFAAGVGITHQVPHVRDLVAGYSNGTVATRKVVLVWIIQSPEHLEWIRPWMTSILGMDKRRDILKILLFVTRPRSTKEIHSPSSSVQMFPGKPDVGALLSKEQEKQVGAMAVSVCGTGSLADDVRKGCYHGSTAEKLDYVGTIYVAVWKKEEQMNGVLMSVWRQDGSECLKAPPLRSECFGTASSLLRSAFLHTLRLGNGSYTDTSTLQSLSFPAVRDLATLLSTSLVHLYNLQPGKTVSLFAGNSILYPVAMWAAVRVGARVNGANPAYGVVETCEALRVAGTSVLFVGPEGLGVALEAVERVGMGRERVVVLCEEAEWDGKMQGVRSLGELVELGRKLEEVLEWSIPSGLTNKDVCGYLNFSSGTTGKPKAVMLSHHNIIAQCHQLAQQQVVSPGQQYKILAVMPLFHITGLVRFCHYPVFMKGQCFMLPKFDFATMLQTIIKYRIEELILVPPIMIRIVKDPTAQPFLPNLREVVKRWSSGSAPISPEIIALLQNEFPNAGFRQGYGATESTACIFAHPPSHFDYKYATTVGKLMANTTAKVISLTDPSVELGPNETGEICAKGPQIAMGYLDNEAATKETFKDHWLHTGDVGYIDNEGLLHISDRIKEMIKVKGQQVAPAELEDLLLGHEAVEDVAVVGIADEYAGERPKAVVVLKKSVEAGDAVGRKLLEWVKGRKVRYKWVKEVEFVSEVPKSATGKLLRRVLRDRERTGVARGLVVRDERVAAKL